MKVIFKLLVCAAVIALSSAAFAQMPAAQRIPPALEKKVTLRASPDQVWEYISDLSNYKDFAGVREFRDEDGTITLVTHEGSARTQTVGIRVPQIRRIAFEVTESDYPTDRKWHYGFEVLPGGNKSRSEVVMFVQFGFDPLPEGMKKALEQEFDRIAEGLKKKFK